MNETVPPAPRRPLGRLKRRPDFLRVAAANRKAAMPGVLLQAAPQPPGTPEALRLGLTASKKVGNAVTRNRARRRLREAARQVLPAEAKPGHDIVLVARRDTATRPFAKLVADLRRALARVLGGGEGGGR